MVNRVALNVVHYPVRGGPHNRTFRLSQPLSEQGWDTIALLPEEPGNALEFLRSRGVSVITIPLHRFRRSNDPRTHLGMVLRFWPEVLAIRKILRERKIDLVVICGVANAHAGFAAKLAGVPLVWQVTDTNTPAIVRVPMMQLIARLADCVMFNGQGLYDHHVGSKKLKVPWFVYFPPVDTAHFVPSAERRLRTRTELGIPAEAPVVGTVANINQMKGIEYFVRAASIIYKEMPNTRFVVVGARHETQQRYAAQIDREVAESGIAAENFIFVGARSDVENYYPAMDVKLITSIPFSEGTTTTGMEASACGVPVVATDVGAVREVVIDGETGFIVPPLDPSAIAAATLRLLKNPELHARMSHTGRQYAVERYDVSVCAARHAEAFSAALAYRKKRVGEESQLPQEPEPAVSNEDPN